MSAVKQPKSGIKVTLTLEEYDDRLNQAVSAAVKERERLFYEYLGWQHPDFPIHGVCASNYVTDGPSLREEISVPVGDSPGQDVEAIPPGRRVYKMECREGSTETTYINADGSYSYDRVIHETVFESELTHNLGILEKSEARIVVLDRKIAELYKVLRKLQLANIKTGPNNFEKKSEEVSYYRRVEVAVEHTNGRVERLEKDLKSVEGLIVSAREGKFGFGQITPDRF